MFLLCNRASICAGSSKTIDFVRHMASTTFLGQLSTPLMPVLYNRPRHLSSSSHETQCDVHRFGELQLFVGTSCDVTVSSLNPDVYLDQNLVLVNDVASRLSVDYKNSSDGISHVVVSESEDSKTTSRRSDVCHIQVPIKYGSFLSFCFNINVFI